MRVKKVKVEIPDKLTAEPQVDEQGNKIDPEAILLKKRLEKFGFFDEKGNWRQK